MKQEDAKSLAWHRVHHFINSLDVKKKSDADNANIVRGSYTNVLHECE